MTREAELRERLATGSTDLVVDLYLYPTAAGGKIIPITLAYGCPCAKDESFEESWDCYPLIEALMQPGERRRVGIVFLSGMMAVEALSTSEKLYLWEGRCIGEADIVR